MDGFKRWTRGLEWSDATIWLAVPAVIWEPALSIIVALWAFGACWATLAALDDAIPEPEAIPSEEGWWAGYLCDLDTLPTKGDGRMPPCPYKDGWRRVAWMDGWRAGCEERLASGAVGGFI